MNFNTSHVSVNRNQMKGVVTWWKNFNTSHVSVNRYWPYGNCNNNYISIHLMLVLINFPATPSSINAYFNTSHVSVNQKSIFPIAFLPFISIHLMLVLIIFTHIKQHLYENFNTSHVSVNQNNGLTVNKETIFQYISC